MAGIRRLAAFTVVFCAGATAAEPAVRPDVAVGDEWHFAAYSSVPTDVANRIWVVTAVAADHVEGTENGLPLRLTRDLNVVDSPRASESNPQLLRFPLQVGKTWDFRSEWSFKLKGSKGTITTRVRVLAHERVRVPAGEFDAYRLLAIGRLGGTSPFGSTYDGETTTTYWYAPAARTIVRTEYHNPYLGRSTTVLMAMRRR